MREQCEPLVRKATSQFLNDQVNDRLKSALGGSNFAPIDAESGSDVVASQPEAQDDLNRDTELDTTLEELEGYQIVKAIACEVETRHPIDTLDDIYQHAASIREAVQAYAAA